MFETAATKVQKAPRSMRPSSTTGSLRLWISRTSPIFLQRLHRPRRFATTSHLSARSDPPRRIRTRRNAAQRHLVHDLQGYELFDRSKDIAETNNLADENPQIRTCLAVKLGSYLESVQA